MLVLDAFNVLHTVGVLPPELAGVDLPQLAGLIGRSRFASQHTVFVCDGLPAADMPGPGPIDATDAEAGEGFHAEVRYSGTHSTADDEIRTMIDASTAPRRLIIVSSDHAIIRHARKRRCVAMTSQEFLQLLANDARLHAAGTGSPVRRPTTISEEQVRQWINVFDVDASSIEEEVARSELPLHADEASPSVLDDRPEHEQPSRDREMREAGGEDTKDRPEDLPADLIAEAEVMWQKDTTTRSSASPPNVSPNAPMNAPPNAPDPSSSASGEAATDERRSADDDPEEIDPLDMNSILPADGRTLPLRKRLNRHRPQK